MKAAVRRGDLYDPTLANNGARVLVGVGFVVDKQAVINQAVQGTGTSFTIWQTPFSPFLIEQALIQVTGNCAAAVNPASPALKLICNGVELVAGLMSPWNGISYVVGANSQNRTIWGLAANEKAAAFTGFPGSGTGDRGAIGGNGQAFAALADGGANGFFGKPITLQVSHGVAGGVQMTIPYRVLLVGHLL